MCQTLTQLLDAFRILWNNYCMCLPNFATIIKWVNATVIECVCQTTLQLLKTIFQLLQWPKIRQQFLEWTLRSCINYSRFLFCEKQFTIVNDNLGTGPLGSVFLPKFSGNCGQAFNNKIGCCETIISFYSIHCDKGRTRLNQFLKNSRELQVLLLHSASW